MVARVPSITSRNRVKPPTPRATIKALRPNPTALAPTESGILGLRPRCNAYSLSLPPTASSTRLMILLRISTTWFSVSGFSMLS